MTKCNVVIAIVMAGLVSLSARAGESKPLTGVINVNTATAEELILLPGVGTGKARLILEARQQKPFATKEDLLAVKGIGEKLLAQWEPYLAFTGATTLKEAAPAPVVVAPVAK
ncbi:MAG: helix-hairpin-helix domain-containing protein [Deltaproteobacteria bacterium]|nr:helix-hairpin-helix domain-containing protein [Deltaproteobacteria bacterium]